MKLQHGGIVVTDALTPFVTSEVTPPHFDFLAQNGYKKIAFMLGGIRGAQAVATRPYVGQKHFAPLPCRLVDPGLVARDLSGAHLARWLDAQLSPPGSEEFVN